jgi:FkbH-like protein
MKMNDTIKYTELLRRNAELGRVSDSTFRVAVLANITITSIKEVLEFSLRSRGIGASVTIGDYENIAQGSAKFRDHEAIVIFFELAAIVDNLPFELHRIDATGIETLIVKAKQELAFTFDALAGARLVLLNLLTALPFTHRSPGDTPLDRLCREVNEFIRARAPKSFRLVDLDKILAGQSVRDCIDLRFFLSSRALYQYSFLRAYSEFIYPLIGITAGQHKKVLVLDCDNTLWKGILGEDGPRGIQMFAEVQSLAVQLAQSGVLICLCSKNNPEDIEALLTDPRMVLRDEHLIVKAINWKNKADNLSQIAETLDLGLDSFVFVDDSDFELDLVHRMLPSVTTFKVPAVYAEYLWSFQTVAGLFYREDTTAEDRAKTAQYRTEFARQGDRMRFEKVEDYLASLELSVKLTANDARLLPRLAQLTQKTNQFNLTTVRMTESELTAASANPNYLVLGIDVSDKFGAYGTTGLIVARQSGADAYIDNFLLSCRVLGRRIELKVFDALIELLRSRGAGRIYGVYRATAKNGRVKDLYSRLGFSLIENDAGVIRFRLDVDSYEDSRIEYIKVANA